ncbi:MAG: hypothetical protein Q7K43_03830 [Candidatus Woesearchaeota archaeon]|nr:hypothetical protein [Candidatus Woesearchaeota archaeon]
MKRYETGLAGLLLLASTNFLFPAQKAVLAQEPAPPQKQVQDIKALEDKLTQQPSNPDLFYQIASVHYSAGNQAKAQEYFNKGVAIDMKKKTCDEILAGAPVEFVKYNGKTKTTNFDELVFQEHLPVEKRMPVLVMVYHNDASWSSASTDKKDACKREGIVFKELSKHYKGKIKFVCFEADTDPNLAGKNKDYVNLGLKLGKIKSIPSICLYSSRDIASGERFKEVQQIDILRGGPLRNEQVFMWSTDFPKWWIDPNIFGIENSDRKLYRFLNTGDYKEVADTKTALLK